MSVFVAVIAVASAGALGSTFAAPQAGTAATTLGSASAGVQTFDAAWSAIRESYVDETRSEADWDNLRREFRPRVEAAAGPDEVRDLLRQLLARIGRSHFDLLSAAVHHRLTAVAASPEQVGTIGLELAPIGTDLVVTRLDPAGPAANAGVRPGMTLDTVDGEDLRQVPAESGTAGDGFRRWALAQSLLRGTTGSTVRLTGRDLSDLERTFAIERSREPGQAVTVGHLPTFFARLAESWLDAPGSRRVALIRFNVWMVPLAPALDRAVDTARDADGIIIDVRNNPGGVLSMLMGVSGHFLDSPVRLGTLHTRESDLNLVANPRTVAPDGRRVTPYAGRLAILVDQTSYSAS
jgi:carboxyl-terminal processing protease